MCDYGTRTGFGQLGLFSPHYWLIIKDAWSIMAYFAELIKLVWVETIFAGTYNPSSDQFGS